MPKGIESYRLISSYCKKKMIAIKMALNLLNEKHFTSHELVNFMFNASFKIPENGFHFD